ncbi:hypothetical protein [Mesorhizobium sp. B1-1-7]|uniref:hypothetical protein n=1 Tax=Mesorhizobium sp. B1-1-7 TaxID=2589977 RepID=UPI00112EE0A6|nr:hypothetical protein [Mesorhizobium sp. B1-1-7]TPN46364.1 hypothetical protein FJ978_24870 [Mesorhizobium sp. B1-1-7]
MFRFTAFFFVLVWCGSAQAADDAVAQFKNYLPSDILKLSKEEISKSVPMMYTGAANLATSKGGDLVIQAQLNTLMYDGLANYENAKKAFQADLGEKSTGELTVWQIHTLGYRSARANMTYVSFFSLDYGGVMNEDWASVKGTLQILDERIAYPINNVAITCDRVRATCDYRQVALMLPDENSWTQSYSVGQVANETYRITRWDGNQIDAVPYENTACRTNQLSLNFTTKEFFEIARNNTAGDCETGLGVTLPKLEKPRVSQIVDGGKIADAEFKRINDEAYGFMSNAFRKKIDALNSK